jgi:hypothetical protein
MKSRYAGACSWLMMAAFGQPLNQNRRTACEEDSFYNKILSARRPAAPRQNVKILLISSMFLLVCLTFSQRKVHRCSYHGYSSVGTGASGNLFQMNENVLKNQDNANWNPFDVGPDHTSSVLEEETCSIPLVGVVTTVASNNQVYDIFRNFLKSYDNAHLVVILDKGFDMATFAPDLVDQARIHVLSLEDQNRMYPQISFRMPLNHFSRKNIGYLHAIAIGACFIWDFDDDNDGFNVPLLHSLNRMDVLDQDISLGDFLEPIACIYSDSRSINPYLMYGPEKFVWPRGFPIEETKERLFPIIGSMERCGNGTIDIIQVIQTIDPDVDGIWRLQNPLPLRWHIPHLLRNNSVLAVHANNFAPYNAQSTLVSRNAFWSLYLPFTVHGRVSDIWRSYFKQAISPWVGGMIGFIEPNVSHHRNYHNNLADFNAEQPLYERSGELVGFLASNLDHFASKGDDALDALVRVYYAVGTNGLFDGHMQEELQGVLAWTHALRSLTRVPSAENIHVSKVTEERSQSSNKDVLQVVHVNNGWISNIPVIEALTSSRYQKVYYVPGIDNCIQISGLNVHCISDDHGGFYAYESLIHAFKNYAGYEKYVFTQDDATVRQTSLVRFLRSNHSVIPSFATQNMADTREKKPRFIEAMKHLKEGKSTCNLLDTDIDWKRGNADFFIVTRDLFQHMMPDLVKMRWAEIPLENAIPTVFDSCTDQFDILSFHTSWGDRRVLPSVLVKEFCASSSWDAVHPVKISSLEGFKAYLTAMAC